jgi:uncharacterized protein
MHYVIHAYDGTDEGALERRMAVRQKHLDGIAEIKAKGQYVIGGALLDADGKMIGSMVVFDFETEQQLKDWQANEPYIQGNVWQKITIDLFRQAKV